jgi:very-short-patch-repair endonuclease
VDQRIAGHGYDVFMRRKSPKLVFEIAGTRTPLVPGGCTKKALRREIHAARTGDSGSKPCTAGKRKLARKLRRSQTHWELLACRFLNEAGIRFLPQHIVRGYIADIAIPARRLIIELDGKGHLEPAKARYDRARTQHLTKAGWRVIRFMNSEILDQPAAQQRFLSRVRKVSVS